MGLEPEKPIDRSVVLADRGPELFRSIVAGKELQPQSAEGQAILERPTGYRPAPQRTRCKACNSRTPTCLPRCGYCGADNPDYSEIADAVARGAKHGGYLKSQPPVADTDAVLSAMEPGAKANLARWSGDLMSEMRRRKQADEASGPAPHM